jgi:hypothetical protein
MKAPSLPYSNLVVGFPDHFRAGSENADVYGYDNDELRGNDVVGGTHGYFTNASGVFYSLLYFISIKI